VDSFGVKYVELANPKRRMIMSEQPINPELTSDDKLWAALGYPIALVALIVLFMEDKKNRPFIKYHAVQSLAVNVALFIVIFIFGCILAIVTFFIGGLGGTLPSVLWLVTLWPAYEAYNGKYLEIPFITNFIKKQGWS
jgi:uncharacterized membrane protein